MQNEINLINQNGQAVVSSRVVAQDFGKRHSDVLRSIEDLNKEMSTTQNCVLFIESQYKASNGKTNKEYLLTRDGFSLLVMGFTGKEALQWKLKYIEAFNKMEEMIKNNTPTLSPMQLCAVTIFDNTASEIDRINALQEFQKISIETGVEQGKFQGMKHLCNNGVVTIPDIMQYVKEEYNYYFDYACDIISTEWSRYLKHMGYLHTVQFRRKDGRGMESKPVYQPTKMFEEVFVEQGMAIIREIDDRGKVEISYTIEIEKFLLSDTFKTSFFEYLNRKFPKVDMIMSA